MRVGRLSEGVFSRGHFVENNAEGELIGAEVDGAAGGLLGRHITEGTQENAGFSLGDGRRIVEIALAARGGFCQAEVEDFDGVGRNHDVFGFQIAVNDTEFVGLGEALGDLNGDGNDFANGKRPGIEEFAKGSPFEELEHQEIDAVVVADVVESANIRMRDLGDGASLVFEALAMFGVAGESLRENFEGHRAAETDVASAVDFSHAAGSERREDFVRAKPGTGRERHKWRDYN